MTLKQYLALYEQYGPLLSDQKDVTQAAKDGHDIALMVMEEPEFENDPDISGLLTSLYLSYQKFVDKVKAKLEPKPAASVAEPKAAKQTKPAAEPKAAKQAKPAAEPKAAKQAKPAAVPKAAKQAKPAAVPKVKPASKSATTAKPKSIQGRSVPKISPSIRFIQRFLELADGKPTPLSEAKLLFRAINIAANERRVTKRNPHSEYVKLIANYLHSEITAAGSNKNIVVTISDDSRKKLELVANSQHKNEGVVLLNKYIRMTADGGATKEKVGNLLGEVMRALDTKVISAKSPYLGPLQQLRKLLDGKYKDGGKNADMVPMVMELRGLDGLDGLEGIVAKKVTPPVPKGISTAADLVNLPMETMHLPGKAGKLLGPIASGSKILLSCKPGQGKTFWALDLAATLSDMGKRVLFVSGEEYGSPTLSAKLQKLDIPTSRGASIHFAESLDAYTVDYDVLVIDSIQKAKLDIESFNKFAKSDAGKRTMMVLISQVTKEGTARGSNEWPHDVDIVVTLESGYAITTKNRFNDNNKVKVR